MTLLGATDWGCKIINVPESSQEVRFRTVGKPIDCTELRLINEDGREVLLGEVGEIQGRRPTGVSGCVRVLQGFGSHYEGLDRRWAVQGRGSGQA